MYHLSFLFMTELGLELQFSRRKNVDGWVLFIKDAIIQDSTPGRRTTGEKLLLVNKKEIEIHPYINNRVGLHS
ncbi:MAG: hypothetical protein JWQ40_3268 [Segetibacter sp.]|nr:hypothetical protein [Segetibacter sp.]